MIARLPYLKDLGVTVIEIMPVAAFPGTRNWGYDGVSPYAVQASYGGPEGLKRLVNAAHAIGMAVMLDVVYNHLGPEGNYLRLFGPYFTDKHQTPWGEAINYDQPGCEGVRRYFAENALYWMREYHLDGLRLDAVQTIKDDYRDTFWLKSKPMSQRWPLNLAATFASLLKPMRTTPKSFAPQKPAAMVSTQSGATISITPCTRSLPASAKAITRILASQSRFARSHARLCLSG